MRVRFWGTRGSIASPGPSTVRYGGNTSCVELRTRGGTLLVLDAGTGLRALGDALMKGPEHARRGHLLIGHTHWDHIQGFPFFAPFFVPGSEWDVYAPRGLEGTLRDALAGQMHYRYFPVPLERLGATIRFHDLVEGRLRIDDATITAQYLNHPALTLGYRVAADGAVVVYATDHECHARESAMPGPWEEGAIGRHDARDAHHAALLAGADLVIHDTQYTAAEYPQRVGWGHSTLEYAVDVALAAGARSLAIYHHDPRRDDAAVDALVELGRERVRSAGRSLEVLAAAEGLTLDVEGTGDAARDLDPGDALAPVDVRAATTRPALVVCAPGAVQATLVAALRAEGVAVTSTADPREARAIAAEGALSIALVDRSFADVELPFVDPPPPVLRVAVDGAGPVPTADDPVDDWLSAPFSEEYARTRIRAALLRTRVRWATAPLGADEPRRLDALRRTGIVGASGEEAFERVVRLAMRALSVPVALVTFVDAERQWCPVRLGDLPQEVHRDRAFCAHAIVAGAALVVPDATRDARFADNPLVRDAPRIRFYAGHPFRAPGGELLGTVCVLDQHPRDLAPDELAVLRDLAGIVEVELRDRARR